MDTNEWNLVLFSLKEMFKFDEDILWNVYFNNNMNLEKTIDNLLELTNENNHIQNTNNNTEQMLDFNDIKEKKPSIVLQRLTRLIPNLRIKKHKYNKIEDQNLE